MHALLCAVAQKSASAVTRGPGWSACILAEGLGEGLRESAGDGLGEGEGESAGEGLGDGLGDAAAGDGLGDGDGESAGDGPAQGSRQWSTNALPSPGRLNSSSKCVNVLVLDMAACGSLHIYLTDILHPVHTSAHTLMSLCQYIGNTSAHACTMSHYTHMCIVK